MKLLRFLVFLFIGTSLMTLSNIGSDETSANPLNPATASQVQKDNLPNSGSNALIKVELVPYKVSAENMRNYADISLTLSNFSRTSIEIEITQVAVLASGSNQVLLVATPEELNVSSRVSLQAGNNKVLKYRLRSGQERYKGISKVVAVVSYRQNGDSEKAAVSDSVLVTVKKRS
jgi:hypothetical protein